MNETSIYLIDKLQEYEDDYSKELRKVLVRSLGQKWSVIRNDIDNMINAVEKALCFLYDLGMNTAFSEILYPDID